MKADLAEMALLQNGPFERLSGGPSLPSTAAPPGQETSVEILHAVRVK